MSSLGLKLELIYFREQTDVRLEFGIRSEYPMRILTTSCEDFEEYLFALKKAVARNHVMIVVGGFGKRGSIIEVTALAVGRKMLPYQPAGNTPGAPAFLPEGALPIFEGGAFVGLILESADQSILLLSERYFDRSALVKNQLAPYLATKYRALLDKSIQEKGSELC